MGNDYDFGKEKVHISSEVLTKTVNSYFTRNVHTHLTTNIYHNDDKGFMDIQTPGNEQNSLGYVVHSVLLSKESEGAWSGMERTEDITVTKTGCILIYSLTGLMAGSWTSLFCNFVYYFKSLQIVCN